MQYITTKLVDAELAVKILSRIYTNHQPTPDCTEREEGYKITYPDGYVSWCPRNEFLKHAIALDPNPHLRTQAPSISQDMVDDFIRDYEVSTIAGKCTLVRATLRNGYAIVETSECVSPENYDEVLGREICLEKIKDKVWMLLGFLLCQAMGVN